MSKVILIGGAPTTGKSTIAPLVAKHFGLPWISTDQFRQVAFAYAKKADYPELYNSDGFTAEEFLTKFTPEEIIEREMKQGEAVWHGIDHLIKHDYNWKTGFVIEGVAILPHLVAASFKNDTFLQAVFVTDTNRDMIRNVVYNRGLWDEAHKYPDTVKEKEVEWVLLFNQKIKEDAIKYGFPVVEVQKNENDLGNVLASLII